MEPSLSRLSWKKFGTQNGGKQQQKTLDTRKEKTRKELNRRDVFLPCHYFDYIAGTSTGGFVCFWISSDVCLLPLLTMS